MSAASRMVVLSRRDAPMFDIDEQVWRAELSEEVNGPHELTIETTQELEEGMRVLWRDGMLLWHEWAIDQPKRTHGEDLATVGEYGGTWSVQYDLAQCPVNGTLWVSSEEGAYEDVPAATALSILLSVQDVWEVGRVTVGTSAATSIIDTDAWSGLSKLIETFGGEVEPRIVVDGNGVTHRYVDWLDRIGTEDATRRFDYGDDCTEIVRIPAPGPRYCRIIPRGGNEATDEDGVAYSDRIGIEEETVGHVPYIQDDEAAINFRRPNRDGTWHYPTMIVVYSDIDDPEELLAKATEDLHSYTRPATTYEATVQQFARAGLDAHGVALGDDVHVVDRKFGAAPLRLTARVMARKVNMLDESDMELTIGSIGEGLGDAIKDLTADYASLVGNRLKQMITKGGTLVYLNELLDALNAEINATGGYFYIVDGIGARTYDVPVEDPAVGIEAHQVVEMRGGAIRIANSRTSGGDWDWRSVFISGHILAELVTAANIVSGYIGSASGGSFWNLDTGVLRVGRDAMVEGTDCTIIDAGHITTGQIDASLINVINLNASSIVTGTLDAISITGCTITGNTITGGDIIGTSITGGTITGGVITGGTINGAEVNATVGNIGGFTLASDALYDGKDELVSSDAGVYVSPHGISVGDGAIFMTLANGHLTGGNGYSATGYLSFNTVATQSGLKGARVAGLGCVCVLTNSFGVGSYVDYDTDVVYQEGQSGTITVVTSVVGSTVNYQTIHFSKGIMDTILV